MSLAPTEMTTAMRGLADALRAVPVPGTPTGAWRWGVRRRMATVRDALVLEPGPGGGGFAAREVGLHRERDALLRRLSRLGPRVLDDPDLDAVCAELRRLLVDVTHHVQRRHDLAYDEVELELGGSE